MSSRDATPMNRTLAKSCCAAATAADSARHVGHHGAQNHSTMSWPSRLPKSICPPATVETTALGKDAGCEVAADSAWAGSVAARDVVDDVSASVSAVGAGSVAAAWLVGAGAATSVEFWVPAPQAATRNARVGRKAMYLRSRTLVPVGLSGNMEQPTTPCSSNGVTRRV